MYSDIGKTEWTRVVRPWIPKVGETGKGYEAPGFKSRAPDRIFESAGMAEVHELPDRVVLVGLDQLTSARP